MNAHLVATSIVSFLVLSLPAQSSSKPRNFGDDRPLRHKVAELSPDKRQQLLKVVSPSIESWAKEFGYDANGIDGIKRQLLWEEVETPAGEMLFLQGWVDGCGGTGNCMLIILDSLNRVVLDDVSGKEFSILPSTHHGLSDILLGTHGSATQTTQMWFQYDGKRYRAVKCALDDWGEPINDPKFHRAYVNCKTWR